MSDYDKWGNRAPGVPDPMDTFKPHSHRLINSRLLLGGAVVWTIGSFIAPLAKPLFPQETHGIVDALASNVCKGIDLIGVGLLAINAGVNAIRTRRAQREFNRSEASMHSNDSMFTGRGQ